jgi:hypothetical protein
MSVQILPYSAFDYDKIPDLVDSQKHFHLRQGEAFVLSTLRLLLFNHNLHDVFGFMLLHKHFGLKKHEKLVDSAGLTTVWCPYEYNDRNENIFPTTWRVCNGQGLMPYEFAYHIPNTTPDDRRSIDLSDSRYQPFLKEFIDAVEAAGLDNSVSLVLRQKRPVGTESKVWKGTEIPKGEAEIGIPRDAVSANHIRTLKTC